MSNIGHTWKDEVNPVGEVELTDTQLVSVYGAWGNEDIWPSWHESPTHEHFEFTKQIQFVAFEQNIKKEVDIN